MGLFRPYDSKDTADPKVAEPVPAAHPHGEKSVSPKGVPTPTRKQAEAARRQRITPTLTKKEQREREREIKYRQRNVTYAAQDAQPARVLLRDWIDSRWNVAEFMLPAMLLVLALAMLAQYTKNVPILTYSTLATWALLLAVVTDTIVMWRGFRSLLTERLPGTSHKGLFGYALNRSMSIRRFRQPGPRMKRGTKI